MVPLNGLTVDKLKKTMRCIDSAMAKLPEARMQSKDAQWIAEELELAALMLRHSCKLGSCQLLWHYHNVNSLASNGTGAVSQTSIGSSSVSATVPRTNTSICFPSHSLSRGI